MSRKRTLTVPDPVRHSCCLTAILLIISVVSAHASLSVCNRTSRAVKVAIARYDGMQWKSQGWWTLAPTACTAVISSALNARFYYLFAMDGSSGGWDGTHGFCVSSHNRFVIAGRANCVVHGFERKGFFEVDTGNATDYTQTLSD